MRGKQEPERVHLTHAQLLLGTSGAVLSRLEDRVVPLFCLQWEGGCARPAVRRRAEGEARGGGEAAHRPAA